jgi:uncharacterized protein (DUF433 family)
MTGRRTERAPTVMVASRTRRTAIGSPIPLLIWAVSSYRSSGHECDILRVVGAPDGERALFKLAALGDWEYGSGVSQTCARGAESVILDTLDVINPDRRIAMATDLIHDRGLGPEIRGTRITVYDLLLHFLEPSETEEYICRLYELTAEQVAAARAYVLNNPEVVLAEHLKIEARIAEGNPPEVIERAKETRATFLNFKKWLAEREESAAQEQTAEVTSGSIRNGSREFPTFKEWIAQRESRPKEGS